MYFYYNLYHSTIQWLKSQLHCFKNWISSLRVKASVQFSSVTQSCLTLFSLMECSPPGSFVHGIFQARILGWIAIPFSKGSSQFRNRTWVIKLQSNMTDKKCSTLCSSRLMSPIQRSYLWGIKYLMQYSHCSEHYKHLSLGFFFCLFFHAKD